MMYETLPLAVLVPNEPDRRRPLPSVVEVKKWPVFGGAWQNAHGEHLDGLLRDVIGLTAAGFGADDDEIESIIESVIRLIPNLKTGNAVMRPDNGKTPTP